MTHPHPAGQALIALTASGVSLVVETLDGRLPAVAYWGPELPNLTEPTATALVLTGREQPNPNDVDEPIRLSLVPEASIGYTGRPGLRGSRDGAGWSTRFTVDSVALDGAPVDGFVASGPAALEVVASDPEVGLELILQIALLPSGLVRTRGSLRNLLSAPWTLDRLELALPVPETASELLDFAGRWGQERVPQRQPFHAGVHLRENLRGRTGADSAYLLHAGTPGFSFADGEVYAVHTAWSGNHVHYAQLDFGGRRVLGGGESLLPGEIRLDQGQSYRSPWLYGSYGRGMDEVAHRFHRQLRSRPRSVDSARPVTLNVWEAVYFDHDLGRLTALADLAAKVGVERYVLDDGWFGSRRDDRSGLGDWTVSEDVWPDGLHPLVDHVRSLGMQFGLWFEPEMINEDSELARAHPDWIAAARTELPPEARYQQVLNLAIPEAYQHILERISALVSEYGIDYLKWDHNRDLVETGNRRDGGRPVVSAQTAATYRMLDELRERHPRLEIESCSSGGARIDLEVLERTDRVWVSDCIDPLERQRMNRWTAQLIPPEYLGSHIASHRSHTTGRVHDLAFRAGTALFGHLGIEWDLTDASPAELADLRGWIDFYKENRELLLGGDVVRSDLDDPALVAHGVVAPDRSRAIYALAAVALPRAAPGPRIRFRGLSPDRTYRLRPVVIGSSEDRRHGLRPPPWWGQPTGSGKPDDPIHYPGIVLTGATLAAAGVVPPILEPEQVAIFTAEITPQVVGRS